MMLFQEIVKIVEGELLGVVNDYQIIDFCFDTRIPVMNPDVTLFLAFPGQNNQTQENLNEAYQLGIRCFLVEEIPNSLFDDAVYCKVDHVKTALWTLARIYRTRFNFPIIAITGSNGKTTVKEWLYHVLSVDYNIERNPKSYNSQIGVPLALLGSNTKAHFGIYEAGISKPGEMNKHQRLLSPEVGIFTGLGDAHQNNFETITCKLKEKIKLFTFSKQIVCNMDNRIVTDVLKDVFSDSKLFFWSSKNTFANVFLKSIKNENNFTQLIVVHKGKNYCFQIPFSDQISIENAMHCFSFLASQNLLSNSIINRFQSLPRLTMRMERRKGLHQSIIINDSYSNDLMSLKFGLQNLKSEHGKKGLILSDFVDNYLDESQFYSEVVNTIRSQQLDVFVGIGNAWSKFNGKIARKAFFYTSTQDFIKNFNRKSIAFTTLLIKGARTFEFEHVVQLLSAKPHVATLEINLDHLIFNLQYFKSQLEPKTKVMVMLKAFSYGVGSIELAKILSKQHIDYIAVAYPNEGVELRQAGIEEPIVVLNPHEDFIDLMIENQLEPEIFNIQSLYAWINRLNVLRRINYPIHIKVNTGMNRLGFHTNELKPLFNLLNTSFEVELSSVFSHLVDSSSIKHRDFTNQQLSNFNAIVKSFKQNSRNSFNTHILNTNGILNYNTHQHDQVRLGIGLFGIGVSNKEKKNLKPVLKFSSSISQINSIQKGESVGYDRAYIADKELTIATVALGYADGLLRVFGNENVHLIVRGKPCKIVGNICMDMCMIDITDVQAKVGDEVIVFDSENQDLDDFAKQGNMISYEVLCSLSERVERTYTREW